MHTFAQKQNQPQKKASFNVSRSNQVAFSKSHQLYPILDLQRTIGNQATQQLLMQAKPHGLGDPSNAEGVTRFAHDFSQIPVHPKSPINMQAKLTVNHPADEYEQEADRIADQVLAKPEHHVVSGVPPYIQRFPGQPAGQTQAMPASIDRALATHGSPLEPALRKDMEQRFGHDFSRVRVHVGTAAKQSAQDVNAHAYTVGHDIVLCNINFVN